MLAFRILLADLLLLRPVTKDIIQLVPIVFFRAIQALLAFFAVRPKSLAQLKGDQAFFD